MTSSRSRTSERGDRRLLDLAGRMKAGQYRETPLAGKTLAMIFAKSQHPHPGVVRGRARFSWAATRCSFRRATSSSAAASRSRHGAGAVALRGRDHDPHLRARRVEELARYATVPVINGLTDLLHPCQVLADLLRCRKRSADVGSGSASPGSAMATTWRTLDRRRGRCSASSCGSPAPRAIEPDPRARRARASRTVKLAHTITERPRRRCEGADVVNTDVWASMGQEDEAEARRNAFQGYTVDAQLMDAPTPARSSCIACRRTAAKKSPRT